MHDLSMLERETIVEVMRRAIPKLSARQQQCILLEWVGFSHVEVAYILGISCSTTRVHFHRALTKIQEISALVNKPA